MPGHCCASHSRQNVSTSQKAAVSIPARSKPRAKPPIPENKSRQRTLRSAFQRRAHAELATLAREPTLHACGLVDEMELDFFDHGLVLGGAGRPAEFLACLAGRE